MVKEKTVEESGLRIEIETDVVVVKLFVVQKCPSNGTTGRTSARIPKTP